MATIFSIKETTIKSKVGAFKEKILCGISKYAAIIFGLGILIDMTNVVFYILFIGSLAVLFKSQKRLKIASSNQQYTFVEEGKEKYIEYNAGPEKKIFPLSDVSVIKFNERKIEINFWRDLTELCLDSNKFSTRDWANVTTYLRRQAEGDLRNVTLFVSI